MAKIRPEQITSINSKCSNGWILDTEYYIMHSEKILQKRIDIDKQNYLRFKLSYNDHNQIILQIDKFYYKQGDYFATSYGLGKRRILDETQEPRKNINKLINFTKQLTNAKLTDINKDTKVQSGNGIVVPSEDF